MTENSEYQYFGDLRAALHGIYTPVRGLALGAVVVTCFLLVINSSWRATPDSALYLELGESLASGKGYVFNGEPHTYVPPGYPVLVAAIAWLDGGFLGYRILMAILGLCTAGVGYLLILRLFDSHVALLIGGIFAVNHVLVSNSAMTTSDVPFALCFLLSLLALAWAAKRRPGIAGTCLTGIAVGLPVLIRINGWGLPPAAALFLYYAWRDRDSTERWMLLALFLATALTPGILWAAYKSSLPISYSEGTYLGAVWGRSLWTQISIVLTSAWEYVGETSFALTGLSIKTGFVEAVVPALVVVGAVTVFKRGERLFVPLTVIQFCGLVLSPAGSRYLGPILPALYLFLAIGVLKVLEWIAGWRKIKEKSWLVPRSALLIVFFVFSVAQLAQDTLTVFHSRTALQSNGAETGHDLPFFTTARWLKSNAPDAVVLSMHPRVLHYLSGVKTVELVRSGVPEHEVWVDRRNDIRSLIEHNKPSYFFSDGRNPEMLSELRAAVQELGLCLEEVPAASATPRFKLWKIVPGSRKDEPRGPVSPKSGA